MANNNAAIRKIIAATIGRKRLPAKLELDHILPKWAGGTDDPRNLQLLLKKDHQKKTAMENSLREALVQLSKRRKK